MSADVFCLSVINCVDSWPFVKAALKKCSTYVVGIGGGFRDKTKKELTKISLLGRVTGNFNSLLSRKNSLFGCAKKSVRVKATALDLLG